MQNNSSFIKQKLERYESSIPNGFKLSSLVRSIFDDDEFVLGMLVYAEDEEGCKAMIDFIEKTSEVDVTSLTSFALDLEDARSDQNE